MNNIQSKEYFCIFCGVRLRRQQRKFCSNSCKCKSFYKKNPEKCNQWNRKNPMPKVNNDCLICGKKCGRKKYCSKICRPLTFSEPPYWKKLERMNVKCNICLGTILSPHVHHVNGNHKDNRTENLVVVCPTCHLRIHNYKIKKSSKDRQQEIERRILIYRDRVMKNDVINKVIIETIKKKN